MLSKDVIEGLLFSSDNKIFLRKALKVCHLINNKDRNYHAQEHKEMGFLNYFSKPNIICIIDKQIHVYIIGKRIYRNIFPILCFEGTTCILYNESKTELMGQIKEIFRDSFKEYLPMPYMQRIFYIPFEETKKVDIKNSKEVELTTFEEINENITKEEEINMYIFNRVNIGNMLFKSDWSLDIDISKPSLTTYRTSASEILREILKEIK